MELLKNKKILLVDDDQALRQVLKNILETWDLTVIEAQNGHVAKDLLFLHDFSLVLSDIRMPSLNGIEFLHACRRNKKDLPVILMTGYSSEIEDSEEAKDLGAVTLIRKPFSTTELLEVVQKSLGARISPEPEKTLGSSSGDAVASSSSEQRISDQEDYCAVDIERFITSRRAIVDVYLQSPPGKYARIALQGESISVDKLRALKRKGFNQLYIRRVDLSTYRDFNHRIVSAVNQRPEFSTKKKQLILQHASEIFLKDLHLNGIDETYFHKAQSVIHESLATLSDNEKAHALLSDLLSGPDRLYSHSIGVGVYSLMVAKAISDKSPDSLAAISFGALFHDIGKTTVHNGGNYSASQDKYHPIDGVKRLTALSLPPGTLEVVLQHHELCDGTGYPTRLEMRRIHPFALIVSAVNSFCDMVISKNGRACIKPDKAFEKLSHDLRKFSPVALLTLMKLFGGTPSQELLSAAHQDTTLATI